MEAQIDSQKMQQEIQAKIQLMQVEFQYNMQLRGIDAEAARKNEIEKEDRKDQRIQMQGTQQSELIEQRSNNTPPKNFESCRQ